VPGGLSCSPRSSKKTPGHWSAREASPLFWPWEIDGPYRRDPLTKLETGSSGCRLGVIGGAGGLAKPSTAPNREGSILKSATSSLALVLSTVCRKASAESRLLFPTNHDDAPAHQRRRLTPSTGEFGTDASGFPDRLLTLRSEILLD